MTHHLIHLLPLSCLTMLPHHLDQWLHILHTTPFASFWTVLYCYLDIVLSSFSMDRSQCLLISSLVIFNEVVLRVAGDEGMQLEFFLFSYMKEVLDEQASHFFE